MIPWTFLLDDRTAIITRITRGVGLLDVSIFIDVRLPKLEVDFLLHSRLLCLAAWISLF